jgi:hypothetical protein
MKQRIIIYLLLASFTISTPSCDNELNVNADYKETIVVFGLLDPNASKQYIKITKAFITENQNVVEVAQIKDSNYFANIKAELFEESSGRVIPLTAENIEGKEPGVFINEPNILYTTTELLNLNSAYQIRVENLETGNKVDSRCELVGPASIFGPISFFDQDFTISNASSAVISVNFRPSKSASLYDVILDFEYEEFSQFDTNSRDTHLISWKVLNGRSKSSSGSIINNIGTQIFFDLLTTQIQPRTDWERRPVRFRATYIGGGEELGDYISVSRPSIGIVQKQTEYTNIRNGLGLFSSRNIQQSRWLPPSEVTKSTLRLEPKTAALGF